MNPWYHYKHIEISNDGKIDVTTADYDRDEPSFYNTDNYSWVSTIESNFNIIKEEIELFLRKRGFSLNPYFHEGLVDSPQDWQTYAMMVWGIEKTKSAKPFPKTMSFFKSIPGLVAVSISRLDANASIKPHHGDTDAIVRGHFPLTVPIGLPDCGFQVQDEQRAWKEGKVMLFCDAHVHKAWNHSNEPRYVIIFDFIKDYHKKEKKKITSNIIASLLVLAGFYKLKLYRYNIFNKNVASLITSLGLGVRVFNPFIKLIGRFL